MVFLKGHYLYMVYFISFISNFEFQDYTKFRRELDSIYNQIEDSLFDKDQVGDLKDNSEDILLDLDYFLKNNDELYILEREKLVGLKEEVENVISFFNMVDKSNGQLDNIEFYKIINKAGGIITSIPSKNTCAQVIKIQIGDYYAFFLENLTKSTSFKVSYEFLDKRYNLLSRSGEMGLIRRNIRHIGNSRDDENFDQLKFKSLVCEVIDYPL